MVEQLDRRRRDRRGRPAARGSTPDSRSRIIQPSVRTVSLTQNGIRHRTNSSDFAPPARDLGDVHATGNAISSVQRGGHDRHHRGAHEGVPVQRLVDEGAVLRRGSARRRAARRARAATASPARHAAARPGRPATAAPAPEQQQREARAGRGRIRCGAIRHGRRRGNRRRAPRSKPKATVSPTRRSAKLPGLRQRDADLGAASRSRARSTAELAPSNSRLPTRPRKSLRAGRQRGGVAREVDDFGPHEGLDGVARRDRARLRAHAPRDPRR